jgi:hypothetical protein
MYTDFLTIESNAGTTEIYLNGAESSATVTVDLIPQVLNIQIPPGGGSFNYDIQLINSGPATVVDLWIAVTMPNGYEFPVMMRNNINIAAGATIQRNNLTQFVPGSVPAGVYIYRAYVKNPITWEIISQDSIIFEKMAGEGLLAHNLGWALYGWDNNSPVTELMPSKFSVSASPNPFNPETNISFTLPQPGLVTVKVYDILGREVALIYSGYSQSGLNQVTWNASDFASGIYLVQISYDHQRICQKVLLDK